MAASPKYISQSDLENALGVKTVAQIFDDTGGGTANAAAVQALINRAEGVVDGYLATNLTLPIPTATDRLVVEAALEIAIAFCFDRRPAIAKQYGDTARDGHWKRGKQLLEDIKGAQIELPDNKPNESQKNVGGIVYDNSTRMIIDQPGALPGSVGQNSGDF